MTQELTANSASATTAQVIKLVVDAWTAQNKRVTDFFNKYDDDVYLNQVAPGRNRAIYLFGHLIATNDGLLPLFGLGERLFPQLEPLFLANPDKALTDIPALAELKQYWETVNATLNGLFNTMTAEEWLDRHTAVSAEDFATTPSRNKLNVLIGRTVHAGYHFGQLVFLPATK